MNRHLPDQRRLNRQPSALLARLLARSKQVLRIATLPLVIPACLLLGISLYLHLQLLRLLFHHQPLALRGLHTRLSATLLDHRER